MHTQKGILRHHESCKTLWPPGRSNLAPLCVYFMAVFNYTIMYHFFCMIHALFNAQNEWCSLNEASIQYFVSSLSRAQPYALLTSRHSSPAPRQINLSIISRCRNYQVLVFSCTLLLQSIIFRITLGIVSGCVILKKQEKRINRNFAEGCHVGASS